MTNMVPQSPENNQKGWNQLELYGRALVARGKRELYIVSGPLGIGGEGRNGPRSKIGPGKVVVPAFTWKVIMVVPAGTHSPGDVKGDKTRLIAIKMPNDRSVNFDWDKYRCSVEDLEEETGFKFFSAVTDAGFNEKKGEVDSVPIGPPIPVEHN
jgi:endonuclease G, mitochondrial